MQAGISSCAERITGWITSVVASNTKRVELLIINEVERLTSTILSELRGHTTAAASGEIAARFAEVFGARDSKVPSRASLRGSSAT
ncbi:hypothetical protein DM791_15445 [Paenarthrobacter nitroguajacolicus]|nr:hypothetical protein [Paenarthrobacter nitroguajacolicus]